MHVSDGVIDAIGNTPLIRLPRLSTAIGREIYAKAEHLNPGGSIKDRAAKYMVLEAEKDGRLKPGGTIVEGTAGNTGIGLAMVALARGYKALIVMPNNQAAEKYTYLHALRAELVTVPPTKFADQAHFYHTARRLAEERNARGESAFWADQFENEANARAHYATTGPEIWRAMDGRVDALVLSSGTGGTIGGTSRYLKEQDARVRVVLADPAGSGLYSFVKRGEWKSEGSSITEGIGIMRSTANFRQGKIDDALFVSDQKMIDMAHWLLAHEGLFVGTSAALNVWAAATVARGLPAGARVVTFICDGGQRYQSRVFDEAWLKEKGLTPKATELDAILAA
ncbi:MAG: cysteine synthase A [Deltaproteobacteria bacterium]|nr:cysteine synthase A [Deltaproteobacteria bacterium]